MIRLRGLNWEMDCTVYTDKAETWAETIDLLLYSIPEFPGATFTNNLNQAPSGHFSPPLRTSSFPLLERVYANKKWAASTPTFGFFWSNICRFGNATKPCNGSTRTLICRGWDIGCVLSTFLVASIYFPRNSCSFHHMNFKNSDISVSPGSTLRAQYPHVRR